MSPGSAPASQAPGPQTSRAPRSAAYTRDNPSDASNGQDGASAGLDSRGSRVVMDSLLGRTVPAPPGPRAPFRCRAQRWDPPLQSSPKSGSYVEVATVYGCVLEK